MIFRFDKIHYLVFALCSWNWMNICPLRILPLPSSPCFSKCILKNLLLSSNICISIVSLVCMYIWLFCIYVMHIYNSIVRYIIMEYVETKEFDVMSLRGGENREENLSIRVGNSYSSEIVMFRCLAIASFTMTWRQPFLHWLALTQTCRLKTF